MSDYLQGVLTVPVAAIALACAWVAIRHLLALGGKAATNIALRMPPKATRRQRAGFAAVIFGAKRARFFTFGEMAVGVIFGLDADKYNEAVKALNPPIRLSAFEEEGDL